MYYVTNFNSVQSVFNNNRSTFTSADDIADQYISSSKQNTESTYPLTNIGYFSNSKFVLIEVSLPGFKKDNIQLKYNGNIICITAQAEQPAYNLPYNDSLIYLQQNIPVKDVSRKVYLNNAYTNAKIKSIYSNGVLKILVMPISDYMDIEVGSDGNTQNQYTVPNSPNSCSCSSGNQNNSCGSCGSCNSGNQTITCNPYGCHTENNPCHCHQPNIIINCNGGNSGNSGNGNNSSGECNCDIERLDDADILSLFENADETVNSGNQNANEGSNTQNANDGSNTQNANDGSNTQNSNDGSTTQNEEDDSEPLTNDDILSVFG